MKTLLALCLSLLFASTSFADEPENSVPFYSGIDMHYCTLSGGCYVSSFGYEWWTGNLELKDASYAYWTGKAEMKREFRGRSYVAKVFLESWRDPYNTNRITVDVGEEGKPETFSHLQFWVKDLHDFVHFDLEAMEVTT